MKHQPDDGYEPNVDPGEPVRELAGFEYDVSSTLLNRIRRAIVRRTFAAQVTSFTFEMPGAVLKEVWAVLAGALGANDIKKGGQV